ncbi:DUF2829 domain-containing protein [Bacillus halotolerans]|uniref:DUF2829 domain-containing protein n=1 Tax=Bacillus halotolerans TaxID=260554 RepID=UPI001CB98BDB|nr:DUF2829 domain-containing protein [Bacillus halotolerans]
MLVDYQGLMVTEEKAELFKRLRIKFNLDAKSDIGYIPWGWDGVEYYGLSFLDPHNNDVKFREYSKRYLESVPFEEMLRDRVKDEYVREEILEKVSEYKEKKDAPMKFGEALDLLNEGREIARLGWNGKGMFLYLIKGNKLAKALKYGFGEYLGEPTFNDFIVMKTADNMLIPWVPSQTDIRAKDWVIVN